MVPNVKDTDEPTVNSILVQPTTRTMPMYDGNLYNQQINNTPDVEKNISGLKNFSRVGIDLALIVNNASQLYYLYNSNNEVWPGTILAWLLAGKVVQLWRYTLPRRN